VLVEFQDSVVIVALDDDGRLVTVCQTRPGAPERTLELPSGKIEPGETPEEAAERELAEECGLAAARHERLASFWVAPAYSTERCHVFAVSGLAPAPPAAMDDDEDLEVERIALPEAWSRLSDAASLAALGLWSLTAPRH
jgi:ADP-ribose pyrophosphatase